MKSLAFLVFLLLLWATPAMAAPCTVGAPNEEDGCQTTTPSNPQGDWQIMAFNMCEEKSDGDACPVIASGSVADPDFDLVNDAVGIPQRLQFSLEDVNTCTAGSVQIIGRNSSTGTDHIVGTLVIGGVNSLIVSEWRYQFVTTNVSVALAGCAANTLNVRMGLHYLKVNR
jgi:hypothetical protein